MVIINNDITISDDEFEVANVLMDLPYLITNSLSSYRFSYDWGCKKKRSAIVSPPPYSPPRCRKKLSAPPPPPPSKAEASSPNTPLSFSPSESDSKSILLTSNKKKKPAPLNLRKKDLEDTLKEKMVTQQQLKESIDKVMEYYNSLIVENSMLKAKRQKLVMPACTTTTRMEQQQQITIVNDRLHAVPSTSSEYHRQEPLISSYDQIHLAPSTASEYYNQSPLISPLFQSNGGNDWVTPYQQIHSGSNWVHAGAPRSTQFQQYHNQAPPFIINHHNQRIDPVYAVPESGLPVHYPAPLIPHHQNQNQNQRFVPDLNMEYKDQDQVCRERRAARLHANKEKRPRVNPM